MIAELVQCYKDHANEPHNDSMEKLICLVEANECCQKNSALMYQIDENESLFYSLIEKENLWYTLLGIEKV
jgi:hypothetical protein